MKKLENKGSATLVLLAILLIAAVAGVGYYVWSKNQTKETASNTTTRTPVQETVQSNIVAIPSNFKENTTKADELKSKSSTAGLEYQYYVDLDSATIITVMSRPVTDKDSKTATINANAEATTFAKVEFPSATKEVAKSINVKGNGAEGYLVEVSNPANKAYVSYIAAANSEKVVLVTVRTVDTYKAQQQEVVQSLISSLQL